MFVVNAEAHSLSPLLLYMCKRVLGVQKVPVIPDVLEQVKCLLESVGLIVLSEHHVITAAGYHENDGCHVCYRKEKDFLAYTLNQQCKQSIRKLFLNYNKLMLINNLIYWPG